MGSLGACSGLRPAVARSRVLGALAVSYFVLFIKTVKSKVLVAKTSKIKGEKNIKKLDQILGHELDQHLFLLIYSLSQFIRIPKNKDD